MSGHSGLDKTPNTPPCGSRMVAKEPIGTVIGSSITVPPSSTACLLAADALATLK